ncbi:beta strand repeat-containing protein [Methylorubrum aminovorans]
MNSGFGSGTGAGPNDTSITIGGGATIDSPGTAINLGDKAQITIGAGATVTSDNLGNGPTGIGANTIEVGSDSKIDIFGAVQSKGLESGNNSGEAINPRGNGNRITIHQGGRLETLKDGTPTIWFQALRDNELPNTVVNNGVIQAGANGGSLIIGNGGAVIVNFTNGPTGEVLGNLTLGDGEDTVALRGGSQFFGSIATGGGNDIVDMYKGAGFTGSVDGGGGSNTLSLLGDAGDAGSAALIPGSVRNFDAINKRGTSTWTISGSVSDLGSSGVAINVNQGTLVLSGDNDGYQGTTTVAAAGTLQIGEGGSQGSLPGAITNNGVLTFNRTGNLAVPGAITGAGSARQIGAGAVTLAGPLSGVSLRVDAGRLALNGTSTLTTGGAPAVPGGFATAAYVAGGTLDNAGTITATQTANQDGVRIDGATLINSGTITASGSGVFVPAGATLVNTGTISGFTGVFFGNGAANGGLSITGNGSITGTSSDGLSALNVASNVTLGTSVNPLGAVTGTGGSALNIVANGANTVNIVTGGSLTGGNGRGISTSTVDGATSIVQAAGTIRATGDGINAGSSGIGAIGIDTSGGQIGTSANDPVGNAGIVATRSGAGSITVTSGVINATGVGASLQNTSAGAGDVALTARGRITAGTTGINAVTTGNGTVTVSAGPVATTNGSGLVATGRAGPVTVTANDAITAGGAGAAGIFLTGSGAGNTVTVGASGSVSGAIGLRLAGGGTTVLNNGGSIAARAAGGNAIQIDAGTLTLGANSGTLTGSLAITGAAGALAVNRATDLTLANTITGTGTFDQNGAGLLALTGANSAGAGQFTGTANVNAGILAINGTFGDTAGRSTLVNVNSGGTLHGSGTIAGSVTVASGATVSAGNSPGTLTVVGNYGLTSGSTSLFELGTPGVVGGPTNDLIEVGGDLTLAGTLSLVNAADPSASPVAGTYRLFNYGGTLSGRFDAVTSPTPITATVYTTIPNQVNLFLLNAGQVAQYWDGTDTAGTGAGGQGGTAVWNGANTNWTGSPTSSVNAAWASGVGIFAGTAGTVTVAGAQNVQGLQFVTDGYRLAGAGTLNLTGDPFSTSNQSFVTVDGGVGATIANALTGTGGTIGLNKLGAGTLTLAGTNTYTGATSVTAGTLVLAAGGSLTSDVSVAGGAAFSNAGTLAAGLTNAGTATNTGAIAGTLTNSGRFANSGTIAGRVTNTAGTLTNTGTFNGGATVTGGTLVLDAGSLVNGALANSATVTAQGRINGPVTNAAGAVFTNTGTLDGALGNTGTASNAAAILGAVTNTGRFTNSGSVGGLLTQSAGTSTNTGTLSAGAVVTGGTLALDAGSLVTGTVSNSAAVTAQGRINGAVINGPGAAFTLTGALTGLTRVSNDGTLVLAGNGLGVGTLSGNGTVRNASATAATLTVGTGAGGDSTYGGLLQDGAGGGALGLTKTGSGTLTLTGANTYTGATTIAAGTGLQLGDGGTLGSIDGTSGVVADGRLTFNRSDAIAFAPALSGSGIVDQNGSGSVTLTGASTAFTGRANVNAGRLSVNGTFGDIAGNTAVVSVNEGGTLQGTGTIAGAVFVNSGGTASIGVAPSQPPGTLTVGGNYTVNAGSNHIFRLGTPNVVGGATNDLIDVGGTLAVGDPVAFPPVGKRLEPRRRDVLGGLLFPAG